MLKSWRSAATATSENKHALIRSPPLPFSIRRYAPPLTFSRAAWILRQSQRTWCNTQPDILRNEKQEQESPSQPKGGEEVLYYSRMVDPTGVHNKKNGYPALKTAVPEPQQKEG